MDLVLKVVSFDAPFLVRASPICVPVCFCAMPHTRPLYRPTPPFSNTGFTNARAWLADVREHADPHLTCILVGNKVDLCEPPDPSPPLSTSAHPTIAPAPLKQRQVTTQEASQWATEQGLLFVEASAKSGHNVDRAFEDASRDILDKIQRGVFDDDRVGGCLLPFLAPRSSSLCAVTWREAVQTCKRRRGKARSRVHEGSVLLMMYWFRGAIAEIVPYV